MDDPNHIRDLQRMWTFQIQLSDELPELIEAIASEFQLTEDESLIEVLHSVWQLRRISRSVLYDFLGEDC